MVVRKTKKKKIRKRNRTKYNKRKQRGGEYSKMAKAVIKNNIRWIKREEEIDEGDIKQSDIRTDNRPGRGERRRVNIGNKSLLRSDKMWKEIIKERKIDTIKNLSLFDTEKKFDSDIGEFDILDGILSDSIRGGKRNIRSKRKTNKKK